MEFKGTQETVFHVDFFSRGLLLLNGCVYTLYIIVVYEQVHLYNTLQTSSGANEKENDTWCIFPYFL